VCDPGVCGDSVTECRVVEADPPRKLVWRWVVAPRKADRPKSEPMTIAWTLEPEGDGTRVTWTFGGKANSFGAKLMAPIMGLFFNRVMRKCMQEDLDAMRAVAEREAAPAGA